MFHSAGGLTTASEDSKLCLSSASPTTNKTPPTIQLHQQIQWLECVQLSGDIAIQRIKLNHHHNRTTVSEQLFNDPSDT